MTGGPGPSPSPSSELFPAKSLGPEKFLTSEPRLASGPPRVHLTVLGSFLPGVVTLAQACGIAPSFCSAARRESEFLLGDPPGSTWHIGSRCVCVYMCTCMSARMSRGAIMPVWVELVSAAGKAETEQGEEVGKACSPLPAVAASCVALEGGTTQLQLQCTARELTPGLLPPSQL